MFGMFSEELGVLFQDSLDMFMAAVSFLIYLQHVMLQIPSDKFAHI